MAKIVKETAAEKRGRQNMASFVNGGDMESTGVFSNSKTKSDDNQFTKMKKSMDQVTPGKWKSKDKVDGKMP